MILKSWFVRLVRPIAWIVFLFPFSVGFALGVTTKTSLFVVIYGFLAFSFLMCFGFTINALADINVDNLHDGRSKDMNLAKQPLVTKEITYKNALLLSILFVILSLVFAVLIHLVFFLLILGLDIIGFIYSMNPTRFKGKPLSDIICNALAGVLLFAAGMSMEGANIQPAVILGVFLMAANFYIPTVITDFEFDKKAGLKTSAVFFGPNKLIQVMYFLTVGVVLSAIFIYFSENIEFKILSIIMIFYTIIFTGISKVKLKDERLNIHENWILIPFALISLSFFIYGLLKLYGIISY